MPNGFTIALSKAGALFRAAAVFLILCGCDIMAQGDGWTTRSLDKGRITVSYRFSERLDGSGETVTLIEDRTEAIAAVGFQDLIALLENVPRHKEFTGDARSELLETISADEWLIYYFADNPWPVQNSDCVARMVKTADSGAGTVSFLRSAAPDEREMGSVKRATYFNVEYSFTDMGDGKVRIIVTGSSTPPVDVPRWLMASAFPGEPAGGMKKLVKAAGGVLVGATDGDD